MVAILKHGVGERKKVPLFSFGIFSELQQRPHRRVRQKRRSDRKDSTCRAAKRYLERKKRLSSGVIKKHAEPEEEKGLMTDKTALSKSQKK